MKTLLTLVLSFILGISTYAQNDIKIIEKEEGLYEITFFHENGKVSQVGYVDSDKKMQGVWTLYNSEGVKKSQGEYKDGKKTGSWFFGADTELLTIVKYGVDNKVANVYNSESFMNLQLVDSDIEE